MCQHSSLWVASATTCELEVGDVVRANNAIVDLQNVLWYVLCFTEKLIILDEAVVVAADKTYSLEIRQYGM